jgi:hypothetical protein
VPERAGIGERPIFRSDGERLSCRSAFRSLCRTESDKQAIKLRGAVRESVGVALLDMAAARGGAAGLDAVMTRPWGLAGETPTCRR